MDVEPLIVVVVEDNDTKRYSYAREYNEVGLIPIPASNKESAFHEVRTAPMVDLVVTDICLDPDDTSDRSGIELCAALKRAMPALPIAGYSGVVDRMDPKDRDLFDLLDLRGASLSIDADEARYQKYRDLAENYRTWRRAQAGALSPGDEGAVKHFRRSFSPMDRGSDECISKSNARLHMIDASDDLAEEAVLRLQHPVPVWVRPVGGDLIMCEVQLYHFSRLSAVGENESHAFQRLIERLRSLCLELADQPGEDSEESYLRWIFGLSRE